MPDVRWRYHHGELAIQQFPAFNGRFMSFPVAHANTILRVSLDGVRDGYGLHTKQCN